MEPLLDIYIRTGDLRADDVRRHTFKYPPPLELNLAGRTLDTLLGPALPAPRYTDRLAAQRGAHFAERLLDRSAELAYEYVIINLGPSLDSLRGETLIPVADLVVIVGRDKDSPQLAQWIRLRLRKRPQK
jgi:cellulose biosynthesis protein BcsQ